MYNILYIFLFFLTERGNLLNSEVNKSWLFPLTNVPFFVERLIIVALEQRYSVETDAKKRYLIT